MRLAILILVCLSMGRCFVPPLMSDMIPLDDPRVQGTLVPVIEMDPPNKLYWRQRQDEFGIPIYTVLQVFPLQPATLLFDEPIEILWCDGNGGTLGLLVDGVGYEAPPAPGCTTTLDLTPFTDLSADGDGAGVYALRTIPEPSLGLLLLFILLLRERRPAT